MLVDVFIDLSRVPAGIEPLAVFDGPDSIGPLVRRVTCAVASDDTDRVERGTDGWRIVTTSAVAACRDALAAAGADTLPLLVLLGDVRPSAAALGSLLEAVDADPMIGFASARLTGNHAGSVARLDLAGDREIDELPRRVLAEVPDTYLVADAPGRCLLIKAVIGADFGDLDPRFRSVAGALWHYMSRARRCGFRTVICNRVVVDAPGRARPCPPSTISARSLPEADRVLLRELCPDIEKTAVEFGTATAAVSETRLARALPGVYGCRPSLLLDGRNIETSVNGTAIAALGVCRGLHTLAAGWDVTLLCSRDAAASHKLEQSFPGWQVVTTLPARQFSVALRLSQPWHVQEMIDLHVAAASNAYLFLDTISWDAVYPAPRHLDGTWQFMADQADALIFISRYTRDRFHRRFRVGRHMRELVAYLSFDPADYVRKDVRSTRGRRDEFIFVVGNDYDHKDVGPTVNMLSTAFPYEPIVALGPRQATTPRVKMLRSGTLTDLEIHRLYANARMVVFPSFYEGFGFPVLTTLAYGRTLVARRSALLEEVAARCVTGGRIVPFEHRNELLEVVGRILHGEDVATLPLGSELDDGRPLSWQDVAGRILTLLTEMAGDLSRSQFRSRDHAVAQLMAAPISLTDSGLKRPRLSSDLPVTI